MGKERPMTATVASFLRWHDGSKERFAIPLAGMRRHRRGISVGFALPRGGLSMTLSGDELVLLVDNPLSPGDVWDLLMEFDAAPTAVQDGWVCQRCIDNTDPDKPIPRVYPSRDALLRDHVFEPFLAWVNESLAKAEAIGLYEEHGGTWAKLLPLEKPESPWEATCLVSRIPLK